MLSQPRLAAALATARMTAFSPGQSPPPVTMPMRSAIFFSLIFGMEEGIGRGLSRLLARPSQKRGSRYSVRTCVIRQVGRFRPGGQFFRPEKKTHSRPGLYPSLLASAKSASALTFSPFRS